MPYLGNEVAPLVQALEGKELKLDSDGDSSIQASSDDTVVFKTNGSNRWTLNSSGNLFPASTSQGIVLGATSDTASNRLEDYEEGAFTPLIVGTSSAGDYSSKTQIGRYQKIGRNVYCFILFDGSSGTGSGNVKITGLPFIIASGIGGVAAIQYNNNFNLPTGANTPMLYLDPGTSYATTRCNMDAASHTPLPYPSSATYLRCNFFYETV